MIWPEYYVEFYRLNEKILYIDVYFFHPNS